MGQVVEDDHRNHHHYNHSVMLRDRLRSLVPMHFHLQGTFDYDKMKKGSTIFVRYAIQHWCRMINFSSRHPFEDNLYHKGLCIWDTTMVLVVACSLPKILMAHRSLSSRGFCNRCGKTSTKRCHQCHQAYYCSRECQEEDWKRKCHQSACRVLTLTAPVMEGVDFRTHATGEVPFR